MHRKLPVSPCFILAGINHSRDPSPARESAGEPKARRTPCRLCPRGGRRGGFPGAVNRSRWGVCSSSRSDGLARQRLPPAGRRCRFGRHEVPLRINGLPAGASTLPARDGCTAWAAGSLGTPGPPKPSRVLGPIARVRQAGPGSFGVCPARSPARPRRTGRRREARPRGCGAGAPPEASCEEAPPSEVGLRFLRGPASAPLPLSGSPGPIAGA